MKNFQQIRSNILDRQKSIEQAMDVQETLF